MSTYKAQEEAEMKRLEEEMKGMNEAERQEYLKNILRQAENS